MQKVGMKPVYFIGLRYWSGVGIYPQFSAIRVFRCY